ncbi:CDC42 small effector protein 1-like isoform X1 [Sinocyclocheilus rhinocerous]|uniref:CDC42 small effector protein 1-like isoform X1 n=1 Tax=Sinocyclocheilus rhinocerous TaxID=307959 RepID=UPI0007B8A3CB|nr:PREDICTED: CDC42 small effector protein 1-like isoform X1 [Sinocyclocheilus rhinocerous]
MGKLQPHLSALGNRVISTDSSPAQELLHSSRSLGLSFTSKKKKRRRIDRSMIGEPTNFIHLTHIGSGEMADGMQPSGPMQEQMRSKVPHANGRNSLL